MRQRSNLTTLLGVAFLFIGAALVYLVLNDSGDGGSSNANVQQSEVTVFVANGDIAPNTLGSDVIAGGLLRTKRVPAGSQPVGAITSAAGLDNQIFVVAVGDGETITSAQLAVRSLSNITVPEGYDGVAVTMEYTNGGAGYVAPGDRVNVYGLFAEGDTTSGGLDGPQSAPPILARLPRVELLFTNVLVLDVSAQDASSLGTSTADDRTTINRPTTSTPLTYLLAMKPTDIERIVLATSYADLYVSLAADDAPNVGDTPGSDGTNVLAPVSADSGAPQG